MPCLKLKIYHCVAVDVVSLDKELSAVLGSAWSTNTLRTRSSQWSQFISFCVDIGQQSVPASVQTVSRFFVYKSRSCKYSTLDNYLSSIVSLQKWYGYNPEYRETFLIKTVLRGLKNILGNQVKQMQPFSVPQLKLMSAAADKHSPLQVTLWTVIVFSFRTLLRKSNLVPDVPQVLDHVIRRKDVTFYDWGMQVRIRSSKTLRHQEYDLEIPVHFVPDVTFCAASAVKRHIELFPADDDSPMFLKAGRSVLVPLTYSDVFHFIKELASRIGLDPTTVGCHSLRISGAGFLHSIQIPLEDIMSLGDWKSMAVLQYLSTPSYRKHDIQSRVAKSLCG